MRRLSRRMRRHQRDVEGGLLFSWRIPGGSFRRTAIGVLVATTLFAGIGSLVQVKIPLSSRGIRESAQLLVLDPNDPESNDLLDWVRFHSPFPNRWDPGGGEILNTMMDEVTLELEDRARYEPLLQPPILPSPKSGLPGLIGHDVSAMPPPLVEVAPRKLPVADTGAEALSWADGPLAERWGTRVTDWLGSETSSQLGLTASFLVGVDQLGQVTFCLVMDGLGVEESSRLDQWIRKQVVDSVPGQGAQVWDIVRVRIQAVPQVGGGKAP